MARERLDRDPDSARELLDKAHAASKEAITEMRQVARGIHPPVLTDRGLDAALSALAARSPVPVQVRVDVPGAAVADDRGDRLLLRLGGADQRRQALAGHRRPGRRPGSPATGWRSTSATTASAAPTRRRHRPARPAATACAPSTAGALDSPAGGPTVLTVTLPMRTDGGPP